MPFSFPTGYLESPCYVVPIRAALVPFVAGALRQLEAREAWETEEDFQNAYNAIAEYEACMMGSCVSELLESNRQIYRLLDNALYGTEYSASGDPAVITPDIPIVPGSGPGVVPGALARLQRIEHVIDNGINGTFYQGEYESNTAMRNQLADILAALQSGQNLDPDILAQLVAIAGLLA